MAGKHLIFGGKERRFGSQYRPTQKRTANRDQKPNRNNVLTPRTNNRSQHLRHRRIRVLRQLIDLNHAHRQQRD
ncbi:Uncharacterised protein [Vibrio cholerae]|nr:Uncharacterised protein [Vibrio cholerae]CSI93379.1 Uncharacterised protein [Vibrio cholerae]